MNIDYSVVILVINEKLILDGLVYMFEFALKWNKNNKLKKSTMIM